MASNSTPLFIFENPLHAAFIVGFGVIFGGIATAIRFASRNSEKITDYSRYNPWFVLFKGREMTKEESNQHLPPFFWRLYGGFGRVGQVIGGLIVLLGLAGLITSLAKKLM
jgi:hypothetical protein